ncbi:MAG: OsmC family protein [Bacteroidia bacterium]|nr:OsmC family protein [Bacteroidia bacterium]
MNEEISVSWLENMAFKADVNGHEIILDSKPEFGGKDLGAGPKTLMLVALAGCTAMDVISILGKMRIIIDKFDVSVSGELTETHPKQYYKMHIIYTFTGKNLPYDKLQKSIKLSQEQYCGVSAVYRKAIQITSEIKLVESD